MSQANLPNTHTLEVWGDFACFTRPEMKVERFSYPVITPSAARGIFDAIYWDGQRDLEKVGNRTREIIRPYFYWQIMCIEVLEMPRFIALRRNEVKGRVPGTATLNNWMSGKEPPEPLWADSNDETRGRTQRKPWRSRMCAIASLLALSHAPRTSMSLANSMRAFCVERNMASAFSSLIWVVANFPLFLST